MIFDKSKLVETCRLWAGREEYLRKIDEALSIVRRHYVPGKSYVSCSGGKDSLAMVHLIVHNINPNVTVFHWDHGKWLMPRWVEHDILECIRSVPVRNLIVKRYIFGDSCEKARIDYAKWYRAFFKTIEMLNREHGLEVCFLGFRAEESHVRKVRVKREFEIHKSLGVKLVYPLRSWSWLDVWTYLIINNVKYPRIYDMYAKVLGYDKARLVTFFDKEFEGIGTYYLDNVLLWRDRYVRKKDS